MKRWLKRIDLGSNKGFTLVELLVTISILAAVAVISVFSLTAWHNHARFVNSESGAKTLFLCAESALSYYESGGELDGFMAYVQSKGETAAVTVDGKSQTVYALRGDDPELQSLLSPFLFDQTALSHALCLEFVPENGQVFSAFYSTEAASLTYQAGSGGRGGQVSMADRAYEARKKIGLGYYSAIDIANVRIPKLTKLKLTALRLNNDETLNLVWASNAQEIQAVAYDVALYREGEATPLLQLSDLAWGSTGFGARWESCTLADGSAVNVLLSCGQDRSFTLTLDAMVTASLRGASTEGYLLSLMDLLDTGLQADSKVYATVRARPAGEYQNTYIASGTVESNKANPFYGDGTKAGSISLERFRHISNIRYYETLGSAESEATFRLDARGLVWGSAPIFSQTTANAGLDAATVFPTVPNLQKGWTLDGNKYTITGLALGRAEDGQCSLLPSEGDLGLFGSSGGTVKDLTLQDPVLKDDTRAYAAAGMVAGRGSGDLERVVISGEADIQAQIAPVSGEETALGLGGLVGAQEGGKLSGCSMAGRLTGEITKLPAGANRAAGEGAQYYPAGIGGLVGHGAGAAFEKAKNEAAVTGNAMAGGIVGVLDAHEKDASMEACENTGLVLCSAEAAASGHVGRCIGGIVGFSRNASLAHCTSTPQAPGKAFTAAELLERMKGNYVGGIAGFCEQGKLTGCSTKEGGYVLGGSYVGGIAGGVQGDLLNPAGTSVTATNGAYVLGRRYVGGVIGANGAESTVARCVNNGVALAYTEYAGGIAGHNTGIIADCESQIYDYGNQKFTLLSGWVEAWKAAENAAYKGDFTGGIVGYNGVEAGAASNSGLVIYKGKGDALATIVLGGDFTGGVIGFNDVNAKLALGGRAVGSRVSGQDFTGGLIGLNRSAKLYAQAESQGSGLRLSITPYAVDGEDFVGGVIGANILGAGQEASLSLAAGNPMAAVRGKQYVGGVIGYNQVLSGSGSLEDFLKLVTALKASTGVGGGHRYGFDMAKNYTGGVFRAGSKAEQCTITDAGTDHATNNLAVYATAFGGGIVGYNEPNSYLELTHCRNTGNVTQNSPITDADRVSLSAYTGGEFDLYGSCLGGIIGMNPQFGTIEACANTGGVVSADMVSGGVVGVNQGIVRSCQVQVSIGGNANSFVGGVVGINDGDYAYVEACAFESGYIITGKSYVGGLAALNRGHIQLCAMGAKYLTASEDYIGALVGYNMAGGRLAVEEALPNLQSVSGGGYVGGLIGKNAGNLALGQQGAILKASARVEGVNYVGGLIGGHFGGSLTGGKAINYASVTASHGLAGGIIGGVPDGVRFTLTRAENRGPVTASQGMAGGVVGALGEGGALNSCTNYGSVSNPFQGADTGGQRAGGITAVNKGRIESCFVSSQEGAVTIAGRAYLGGIAGENYGQIVSGGLIAQENAITIRDSANQGAQGIGGIAGYNGPGAVIQGVDVEGNIILSQTGGASAACIEALGGVAGENLGRVTDGKVYGFSPSFYNVRYAGGVVGDNQGEVSGYEFTGSLYDQGSSGGGYCIGGVVGRNGSPDTLKAAVVVGCQANLGAGAEGRAAIQATGVFNATITDNHALAARSATLMGGIAGANYQGASITESYISAPDQTMLSAQSAMLGGVVGYNNGTVFACAEDAESYQAVIIAGTSDMDTLDTKAQAQYAVVSGTMSGNAPVITLTVNGHVGGIAGVNGVAGSITDSLSGYWDIRNDSPGPDSCAGGIIGMNVSSQSLSRLVNFAKVTRSKSYVAGGIIGRQECGSSGWRIALCGNYGQVSAQNQNGRFTGGIIGNLKYGCGTLDQCWNRGDLGGTSGGIVGRVYRYATGDTLNLIGCKNYGTATAGILNRVQDGYSGNRVIYINLVDCVNFGQLTSNGAGMVAACTDGTHTTTMLRCRNYGGGGYGMQDGSIKGALICTGCFDITQRDTTGRMKVGTNAKSARNYYLYNTEVAASLAQTDIVPTIAPPAGKTERANPSALFIVKGADGSFYAAGMLYENTLGSIKNNPAAYALSKDNLYIIKADTQEPVAEVVLQLGSTLPALTQGAASAGQVKMDASAVQPYYERLYSVESRLAAPTDVKVTALGRENSAAWENANEFVYYYELEAYCFETERQAQAALSGSLQGSAGDIQALGGYVGSLTGIKAYETKAVFNAPDEWENKAYFVRVRACSTLEGQNSEWAGASGAFASFLTPPEVRGELMTSGGSSYYRFCLEPSLKDALTAEYGAKALASGQAWRVMITAGTAAPVYLSAERPIVRLNMTNNTTLSLKAQAQIVNESDLLKADAVVTSQSVASEAQTLLANYGNENLLKLTGLTASLKGATAGGLTLEAKITRAAGTSSGNFVPTYRVELVKNAGGEETVVAYEDVAMAQTNHTLTLSGLPEDLFTNLQGGDSVYVRAWLAQTALGPAYTYHQLGTDEAGSPVTTEVEYNGASSASYTYAPTSKVHTADMAAGEYDYYYTSALARPNYTRKYDLAAPTLLPAPVLADTAALTIDPASDAASYTFVWDKAADIASAAGGYESAQYQAAVFGLLSDGTQISLYEGKGYAGTPNTEAGVSLTLGGDEIKGWEAYQRVRLLVTRLGEVDASGVTTALGQAASKEYTLDKRLPQVEAPTIATVDLNSLKHTVTWKAVAGEGSGCAGYKVTVAEAAGGTAAPQTFTLDKADFGPGAQRSLVIDLEAFAGKLVRVSVAALGNNGAGTPKVYDSPQGEVLEYNVPARLLNNLLSVTPGWDAALPMLGSRFLSGGLSFTASASEALAGTYVAVGLVGDPGTLAGLTDANAQSWAEWAETQGEAVTRLNQTQLSASGATYTGLFTAGQGLQRAHGGQSLLLLTQATAQSAVSSPWKIMGVYALPKVQLDAPALAAETIQRMVTGQEYTDDLVTPTGTPFTVPLPFKGLSFAPVADAGSYTLSLAGQTTYLTGIDASTGGASTGSAAFQAEYEITAADGGGYTVRVTGSSNSGGGYITATAGNVPLPQTQPTGSTLPLQTDETGAYYYTLAWGHRLQQIQLPTGGGLGTPHLFFYEAETRLYVDPSGSLRLVLADPAALGDFKGSFTTTAVAVTARPAGGSRAFADSAPAAWPGGAP